MTSTTSQLSTRRSPRVFVYILKANVFNFQHGASGQVLSHNTTLNITIPQGAAIRSVYPIPDLPAYGITNNYANVTIPLVVLRGAALQVRPGLRGQPEHKGRGVGPSSPRYISILGIYSYLIIAAVILLFVLYVYYRASK